MTVSENIEITEAEIQEFAETLDREPTTFRPILRIWQEVLKPAVTEKAEPVTAGYAHKITSSYREINFADMEEFRDRYYDKILELAGVLDAQIATDDDCLTYDTPEDDADHNAQHYKRVITDWQLHILQWEKDWSCTDDDAAVELGAISEVQKMFFGGTGLAAMLDNIQFRFTEADQAALLEELQELKDRKDGQ